MAAGNQTLTTVNDILKEKWLQDAISDAFYVGNPLLERFMKSKAMVAGKHYLYPIHTGRNFGTGPRVSTLGASVAATPTPGSQSYDQALLQRKNYYGRFKIHNSVMSAAQRDGTIADVLQKEIAGLTDDVKRDVQVDLYGDGSGVLATATAANSATQTVNSTRYLAEGMPIVFGTSAGVVTDAATNARVIQSVDSDTQITLTASVNSTGITSIFRQGITGTQAEAAANAISGLDLIVGETGIYANINRATAGNGFWKATELASTGGVSLDLMMEAWHRQRSKANGKTTAIICGSRIFRLYGLLIDPQRRYVGSDRKPDAGLDTNQLPFNGIPVIFDPDCPDGLMYFLDESTFELLVETPFGFVENPDGSRLFYDTNYDTFEGVMVFRGELGCNNPAKNLVITGL